MIAVFIMVAVGSCKKKAVKIDPAFIGEWYSVKSGEGNERYINFRKNGKADYDLLGVFGVEVEKKKATIEDDILQIKDYSFTVDQYPRNNNVDTVCSTDTISSIWTTYCTVYDATIILNGDTFYHKVSAYQE